MKATVPPDREHIGGGTFVAPGDYSDVIIVTVENRFGTVLRHVELNELMWQRLCVYGARFGFEIPREVKTPL